MLSFEEVQWLKRFGWTAKEVETWNTALKEKPQSIDFDSPTWQKVIEKRWAWVQNKTEEYMELHDMDSQQAYQAIMDYIDSINAKIKQNLPYVFFRAEYGKAARSVRADYHTAVKARKIHIAQRKAKKLASSVYNMGI